MVILLKNWSKYIKVEEGFGLTTYFFLVELFETILNVQMLRIFEHNWRCGRAVDGLEVRIVLGIATCKKAVITQLIKIEEEEEELKRKKNDKKKEIKKKTKRTTRMKEKSLKRRKKKKRNLKDKDTKKTIFSINSNHNWSVENQPKNVFRC